MKKEVKKEHKEKKAHEMPMASCGAKMHKKEKKK